MNFKQLRYYINLGAPPIRAEADGSEAYMRPEVGFNPSWFHRFCSIDFSEKWHEDPEYRMRSHETMSNEIRKRFSGYNIGESEEIKPPDLLTGIYGIGIIDSILGRSLQYYNDKWPVPIGDPICDDDIEKLSVPDFQSSRFFNGILSQLDRIHQLTGSARGFLNWQGNLNTAFRLRGEQIFLDLMYDSGLCTKLLDTISDTYLEGVNLLYKKQKELGTDYEFATVANCTVNMVGPQNYENILLHYDQKIAQNFEVIGIHNCAWTVTPYIEAYSRIPNLAYIDMGIESELKKVKEKFPAARRNCLYKSIDLKNKTTEEIKKDFEFIADNLAPCDVGMPDIEYDVPDDKIKFAMDLCGELSVTRMNY